jgi:two-component system, OmpR family, alkaline phosphatase synthesis response regulator PhoP
MTSARILIVEDEPDIVFGLQEDLRRQGYDTSVSTDGDDAIRRGTTEVWDLILLDVMLPGANGFEVCAAIRRAGVRTPVILLTAKARESDKEHGLDSGADDYVTKPFSLRELRARIRAQLRRGGNGSDRLVRFADCELDLDRAELRRGGDPVELTAQEFRILQVFVRSAGRVLSREQLIEAAWGQGIAITDRAVDTHVFNLRRKVETDPAAPRVLLSVRGLGYRFNLN